MREEVKDFKRWDLFKYYHSKTNPFSFVTTKVDVKKLYDFCKKRKNYYATMGYYLTLAANSIEEFKYRYEDGKIYKYDNLKSSFTQMFADERIGFFTCEMKDTYDEYIKEYTYIYNKFMSTHQSSDSFDHGEVWFSCEPWFQFSGVITPFDKEITIPQFIWDQFSFENGKCYVNLMIMVHHGFVDGYHIGKFINTFKELIDKLEVEE